MTGTWLQIPVIALSGICFSLAQLIGGSGFIACFIGGLTFGALTKTHKKVVLEAAEVTGDTLALVAWFVFGTLLFTHTLPYLDWRVVTYAIASLTVVRMLPVFLSVAGLGLRTETKLFLDGLDRADWPALCSRYW